MWSKDYVNAENNRNEFSPSRELTFWPQVQVTQSKSRELSIDYLKTLKQQFEPGIDPTQMGDPAVLAGLNQIIQTVGALTKRVDELANQVAELQKKVK